jgi:tetratricopeptide (TPR) repeat protein
MFHRPDQYIYMPADIKLYRIFIASPGGLASEREAFKETITEYNESDAVERNALFLPVGWELTLAGVGRPQALINKDLMKCDYCLLVLWDRWGTSPDNSAKYTSGTEEEFNIALQSFHSKAMPMRQIVVLFKSVDPRQLSDPGLELKKVLEFKKKLETNRSLLFDSFDEVSTFKKKLRRHLAAWTRDHESGELGKATDPRSTPVDPAESLQLDAETNADQDARLLQKDEMSIAKQVAVEDLEALQSYGKILALTQRIPKAREVFELLSTLPQTASTARIASLRQLARIAEEQNSFAEAEELFKRALSIIDQLPPKEQQNRPLVLLDLAFIYDETARFAEGEALMQEALDLRLRQIPQNIPGLAFAYYSLASNMVQQTRAKEAEGPSLESLRLRNIRLGNNNPILIRNFNQLAGITRALGKYPQSEAFIQSAQKLETTDNKVSPSLIASTQVALGILRRDQEQYIEAENLLRQALSTREQQFGSDHRSVATAASELGRVLEEQKRFSEAESLHRRALTSRLKRYGEDNPITARSYNSLGRLYLKQGALREARQLFEKALKTLEETLGGVPLTGVVKLNLGTLLIEKKDALGKPMVQAALKIFVEQLGEQHPYTIRARDLLMVS